MAKLFFILLKCKIYGDFGTNFEDWDELINKKNWFSQTKRFHNLQVQFQHTEEKKWVTQNILQNTQIQTQKNKKAEQIIY